MVVTWLWLLIRSIFLKSQKNTVGGSKKYEIKLMWPYEQVNSTQSSMLIFFCPRRLSFKLLLQTLASTRPLFHFKALAKQPLEDACL